MLSYYLVNSLHLLRVSPLHNHMNNTAYDICKIINGTSTMPFIKSNGVKPGFTLCTHTAGTNVCYR